MERDDWIGWSGTAIILVIYGAGALGLLASTTILYQTLNIIAALAIMYIAHRRHVTERAVLNLLWAAIGVISLIGVLL